MLKKNKKFSGKFVISFKKKRKKKLVQIRATTAQ